MEAFQALASQFQFSLSASQMIISFGILALAAIWGRIRIGALLSLGTFVYWEYAANKTLLFQMAVSNAYGIFVTGVAALILGFLLIYAWALPSSK